MPASPSVTRPKNHIHSQLLDVIQRVTPDADPTNLLLFRQVRIVDKLLVRNAEKQLEIAGLTWPKFMLLFVLLAKEAPGSDGTRPSELSNLQGIPRNNVSALLGSLEKEGLISREIDPEDRRQFIIRLTPVGRRTLKSKLGVQIGQVNRCFAALDASERATLLELLTRLSISLQESAE